MKSIGLLVVGFILIGLCGVVIAVGPNEIIQIIQPTSSPVPTNHVKGATITLGNYSSSATLASNSAVNMVKYRGGSLQITVTSGTTAHWYVATTTAPSTTGTFSTPFIQTSTGTFTQFTNMTTSGTKSFHITGLRDTAVKFIPTLNSGTGKATITFTPSND